MANNQNLSKKPNYLNRTIYLSDHHELRFETEVFPGSPLADTKVILGNQVLCWITYSDIETFLEKLNAVIAEFRI